MIARQSLAALLLGLAMGSGVMHGEAAGTVTVIGSPTDPRIAAVREAMAFWNAELDHAGSAARLGPLHVVEGSVPDEVLRDLSRAVADGRGVRGLGRWVEQDAGEFAVVLSNTDLMSFAVPRRSGLGGIVVLRSADAAPLSLPNVARNVAAHELGHLLGLPHNADPGTLMCGRPAPCRPDLFVSETPRFFPLTHSDEETLREDTP